MALKYRSVKRRDMRKGAAEDAQLYYGQVRLNDRISYEELAGEVSMISTVSKGDTSNVMITLVELIAKHLGKGNSVDLGGAGSLRPSAGSHGVESENDFNTSLFKKAKAVYTPGKEVKYALSQMKYEKLDVVTEKEDCKRPHAG